MKLGEFLDKFSHNNIIRLLYKTREGHETVMMSWSEVSMDWEVRKQRGCFRHFVDNEVVGLASIGVVGKYPEAINIVIEKKYPQPVLSELSEVDEGYAARVKPLPNIGKCLQCSNIRKVPLCSECVDFDNFQSVFK